MRHRRIEEVGTPVRQHNSQETRELIIGSAISLFLEKGYSHTTLEDIVRRVGLTRGAFYWNFKNKKDILDEVVDRYESFYREIYASYTHFDSAYETIKSFLTCDFTKKNTDNPYSKIILYKVEACDELSDLAERQARLDREFTALIEREVKRGQDRGEFRRDKSARVLTLSVYMNLLGFDTYNASQDTGEQGCYFTEEEIADFVEVILSSLS